MKQKNSWNCTNIILNLTSVILIFVCTSCHSRYCSTKKIADISDSLKMEKAIEITLRKVISPQNSIIYTQR